MSLRLFVIGSFLMSVLYMVGSVRFTAAQTSYPFLFAIYPCGLAQGTTVESTLYGLHNYNGAYRAYVSGVGVTAEPIVPAAGWPAADAKTGVVPVVNEIRLRFRAASNAGIGIHEVRVVTPRGVSSAGQIVIGDEPEILEVEPNDDIAHAQAITVPVTINGRIQASEDMDTFKFEAKAGESITFSVICARLQDKIHDLQDHADPMLTLRDSTGRELASADDYYRADPLLNYKFEKAGAYFIQIRDVRYTGNSYWVYRLNITKRPYVTSALPMTIKAGVPTVFVGTGFNLPTGAEIRGTLLQDTPSGITTVQLDSAAGKTNPVPMLVTDLPCVRAPESMPMGNTMPITVPSVISGNLTKPGDLHRFRFHALAGELYSFDVSARRFDSRIDSILTLYDAKGAVIVQNDDANGPDSHIDWTCPSPNDYSVEVKDLHGRGGPNFVYALTVERGAPDFILRCDDDKMRLGPGNSAAWYVLVERKHGFGNPITINVTGLPPGVTAAPLIIPNNMTQGCVILTASSTAKPDCSLVKITGTAESKTWDGKSVMLSRIATPQSEIYLPGGGRAIYPVELQPVSIAVEPDILIELSQTNITLAPGGSVKIDVTIKRSPSFKKNVTLDMYLRHLGSVYGNPLPPGVTMDEGASKTLIADNETKGHIVLKADATAAPISNLPIAVLGSISINFVVKVSYSGPPVFLTVKK